MQKILVVQTAFIGDIILSTPVFRVLKTIFPLAKIHLMTTAAGAALLRDFPEIDQIHVASKNKKRLRIKNSLELLKRLRQEKYQLVVSLHKSPRTALLLRLSGIRQRYAFATAKLGGLYTQLVEQNPELHAVERTYQMAEHLAAEQGIEIPSATIAVPTLPEQIPELRESKPYIVLAPGSVWATKRWPVRYYQQLAQQFEERGYQIVITGSAAEMQYNSAAATEQTLDLTGKTDFAQLFTVVKRAALLICNDSMILHGASALKTPTAVVFCSTIPEFGFGPFKNHSVVLENKTLACRPCGRHGKTACPLATDACMQSVLPHQVLAAGIKLMDEVKKSPDV